jgi:predicted O-methyltransferase YrrM
MATIKELRDAVAAKQFELRAAIEALMKETKEPFIAWAPTLPEELLAHCRVLPSRDRLLDFMPKGGVCAEVGTQTGYFAKKIMTTTQPSEFHIIDIDMSLFDRAAFAADIDANRVHIHEGDSSSILASFADGKFDWIYIDADHSYEGFVKDLEVSARKVKSSGYIVCNDYTVWSPAEVFGYGVLRGVNEFCAKNQWEFVYIGLHGQGYHDVCIRRHTAL